MKLRSPEFTKNNPSTANSGFSNKLSRIAFATSAFLSSSDATLSGVLPLSSCAKCIFLSAPACAAAAVISILATSTLFASTAQCNAVF